MEDRRMSGNPMPGQKYFIYMKEKELLITSEICNYPTALTANLIQFTIY